MSSFLSLVIVQGLFFVYMLKGGIRLGYALLLPFTNIHLDPIYPASTSLFEQHKKADELWLVLAFFALLTLSDAWRGLMPILQAPLLSLLLFFCLHYALLLLERQQRKTTRFPVIACCLAANALVITSLLTYIVIVVAGLERVTDIPAHILVLVALFLTTPSLCIMLAVQRLPKSPFVDRLSLGIVLFLCMLLPVISLLPIQSADTLWHQLPLAVPLALIPFFLCVNAVALVASIKARLAHPPYPTLCAPPFLAYSFSLLTFIGLGITLQTPHHHAIDQASLTPSSTISLWALLFIIASVIVLLWWEETSRRMRLLRVFHRLGLTSPFRFLWKEGKR
ncbi:MAG: hypothetical protein GDA54_03735 [Alphaproteobacteria bacterium GM7ARS4]|nr:hypothetical protein [Alphaproteobacteria bacterium GM7ARS4]